MTTIETLEAAIINSNKFCILEKETVVEAKAELESGTQLRRDYNELLYAVARKFPDETRHQTALRYIQEAERSTSSGECHDAASNFPLPL